MADTSSNSSSKKQQQQQPDNSTELVQLLVKDLKKYGEDNCAASMKDPIQSAVSVLISQIAQLHAIPSTLPPHLKEALGGEKPLLQCEQTQDFKEQLTSFLMHSVKSRIALSRLVLNYLSELERVFQTKSTSLEVDQTGGYFAASVLSLTQILDKIIVNQENAVKDIQSSYRVVATNAAYPLATQRKIDQGANLYLIRYHSTCVGCKLKPPIAKALLQNVPLCEDCLQKEKELLFPAAAATPSTPEE